MAEADCKKFFLEPNEDPQDTYADLLANMALSQDSKNLIIANPTDRNLRVEVELWQLNNKDKRDFEANLGDALLKLADHRNAYAIGELLYWSPFWLDALSHKQLGFDIRSPQAYLVRYRLAELFIRKIALQQDANRDWPSIQKLLIFQRYRYLRCLRTNSTWSGFVEDFHGRYREARHAYGRMLINEPEAFALALSLVKIPDNAWHYTREVAELATEIQRQAKVSANPSADIALAELLLRQGLLKRNNLALAAEVMAEQALTTSKSAMQQTIIKFFRRFFHYLVMASAATLLFVLCLTAEIPISAWVRYALFFLPIFLLGTASLTWGITASHLKWRPVAFYPLALRIPGMILIGIFAIFGIAEGFTRFAFLAFPHYAGPGWVVIVGSLLASLLYLVLQTANHSHSRRETISSSLHLYAYSAAVSVWLVTVTAWFAQPLGLLECISGPGCNDTTGMIQHSFSAHFLGQDVSIVFVVVFGSFSLLLGTITQLLWDEKVAAEPL